MQDRYQQIHEFCKAGDIVQVQKLCNLNNDSNWLFKIACQFKRLHIAGWVLTGGNVTRGQIASSFRSAVKNNNLRAMKWLHNVAAIDVVLEVGWAMPVACSHGYLKAAQWLHSFDERRLTHWLFIEVCGKGHLRLAKWMQRLKDFRIVRRTAIWVALQRGHLRTLKWLLYILHSPCPNVASPAHYTVDQRALKYCVRQNPEIYLGTRTLHLAPFF